jgi:hypothetical protein
MENSRNLRVRQVIEYFKKSDEDVPKVANSRNDDGHPFFSSLVSQTFFFFLKKKGLCGSTLCIFPMGTR